MPLDSLVDLILTGLPDSPCEVCGAQPWQVIDAPATEREIRLCMPCYLEGEEARRNAERS